MIQFYESFLLHYFSESNPSQYHLHLLRLGLDSSYATSWNRFCKRMSEKQIKNARLPNNFIEQALVEVETKS